MKRGPHGQTRERIYQYIYERRMAGEPPTIREIQEALGFKAVQTIQGHLRTLVEEGRLLREPGKARGYRLPDDISPSASPAIAVPILGRVQAGALSTAVQDYEGRVAVHTHTPSDHMFALRVQGESMIDAGILPGDLVIVRKQSSAADRDIVVALVDDEATVKRLRMRENRVELHPENTAFSPIIPDPEQLRILGKVVEVRRTL